jgi:hypothetical protein
VKKDGDCFICRGIGHITPGRPHKPCIVESKVLERNDPKDEKESEKSPSLSGNMLSTSLREILVSSWGREKNTLISTNGCSISFRSLAGDAQE